MADTHFIDARWQPGEGAAFQSRNPVTGEEVWAGTEAGPETVNAAVAAANKAFGDWKRRPLEDRVAILEKFKTLLGEHKEALATLIARETGKPIWESRTEIGAMQGKIDLSVKAYHERTGEHATPTEGGQRILRHKPHGVMAVFGPYNFPGHLPNGHIVPALIAGNTVVFKPSEQTPATAELTVRLWQEAGLPGGVINLVQGARTTGEALSTHPNIHGILFTGSPQTGLAIQAATRTQPQKILALEMGGNNPLIIGSDLDTEAAIWATLQSAFISAGQRCTCARRLLVPAGPDGDAFLEQLVSAAGRLEVGAWDADPQPFMGSVINEATAERLLKAQDDWLNQGGKALLRLQSGAAPTLLSPGIIDLSGVAAADEEFFGPLLNVRRYDHFTQAVEMANDTRFGLSAGLLSNNRAEYDEFMEDIRAGIVNWNQPITGASSAMPFGGPGLSGNYRPSAWYAADYCAYPMASLEHDQMQRPTQLPPGMTL